MIGETLGGYLILDRLGRGGMGTVYRAEDEGGREVALKVIAPGHSDDEQVRRRFAKEAAVLQQLDEPCIVRALSGLLEANDQLFFAMELVDGEDLGKVMQRDGALGAPRATAIAVDVLQALTCAHEGQVLHRDVKPSNVFLTRSGRAKLGDFGLALIQGGSRLTRTGSVLGTPEYMAPEQAEGQEPGEKTDLYAVGVLLHEMLTGQPPFLAATPLAVLRQQVERQPPTLPPTIPAALRAVVARALQKDSADRPASAAAMRQELLQALESLTSAETTELPFSKIELDPGRALAMAETADLVPVAPRSTPPGDEPAPAAREPSLALPIVLLLATVGLGLALALPSLRGDSFEPRDVKTPSTREVPIAPLKKTDVQPAPAKKTDRPVVEDSWVDVQLRNQDRFGGWLVEVDLAEGELVTRSRDGQLRRDPLAQVASYTTLDPPEERRVRVELSSGKTFEATLIRIDLARGLLITRLANGRERHDPLDSVVSYSQPAK